MRLIDADALIEEIESLSVHITGLRAGKGVLANFMNEYRKSVLKIIDEQPTAFDIEKVAEELKKRGYLISVNDGSKCIKVNIAIDIVKRGGIPAAGQEEGEAE